MRIPLIEIPPGPTEDQADARPQLDEDTSTMLLAFLSKQKSTAHPGHLANVLSTSKSKNAKGARFMTKSDANPSKGIARYNPIASTTQSPLTNHRG